MRRLIVAVAALTLLVTSPAEAWTVQDVIRDCSLNGKLSHDYPPSLIRKARNSLPADVDEYTDCRDLLSAPSAGAGSAAGGGGGGSTGGGGGAAGGASGDGGSGSSGGSTATAAPAPPTPSEAKALEAARAGAGAEAVDVGGTPITPGAAGMTTGAVDNGLPSTLLVVLILLALAVAAAAGPLLRRRFAGAGSLTRVLGRRTR